jgi:glycerophosphoryl diester phosphodiesterase
MDKDAFSPVPGRLQAGRSYSRPLLLGHRGAQRGAPENTIPAFDLALEHGCDGFEFDVRGTADAQSIICHDPRVGDLVIDRSTGAALAARCASLCTLEQVLARYAARAFLYIEFKVAGLEDALLAALAGTPPQRGFVVASFLPEVLEEVHLRDVRVPLGFICDQRRALPRWCDLPVTCVMPQHRLATAALVEQVHTAGKQVFIWTVNQEREMRALAELGVDGIVSDDTELLCRTLKTFNNPAS